MRMRHIFLCFLMTLVACSVKSQDIPGSSIVSRTFLSSDGSMKLVQRAYDNADIRNRGTDNYVNVLGKRYTLHTGWLSDDASSRMHHLLNSTDVYLYDIDLGQMIPVTLTSPVTEYKRNPVVRAIDYAVEVAVAQERMRR